MVCPPRAAVLGSRTRVDAYNRSITKPLTGEPDAGDPPVRFGGRGKVQSLVPTPIGGSVGPCPCIGRGVFRFAFQAASRLISGDENCFSLLGRARYLRHSVLDQGTV